MYVCLYALLLLWLSFFSASPSRASSTSWSPYTTKECIHFQTWTFLSRAQQTQDHNLSYLVLCSKNRASQFRLTKTSWYSHLVAINITHQLNCLCYCLVYFGNRSAPAKSNSFFPSILVSLRQIKVRKKLQKGSGLVIVVVSTAKCIQKAANPFWIFFFLSNLPQTCWFWYWHRIKISFAHSAVRQNFLLLTRFVLLVKSDQFTK